MVAGLPAVASAQIGGDDDELRLHNEPTSYTNVIDALDGDDPFDVNVSLGFRRQYSSGQIQREVNNPAVATGRNSANYIPVGQHEHTRNSLEVGLEVGVFHDLELFMNLPIVLSDTRSLSQPSSLDDQRLSNQIRQERQPDGSTLPIFNVPYNSLTRSGIPNVQVGIAWGIFNQFRDEALPNWVVMLSGQFAVGDVMRPSRECAAGETIAFSNSFTGSQTRCSDSVGDPMLPVQNPGITDGVHWIHFETRSSYRLRYIEPYAGLHFMAGFPAQASDQFKPGGDLDGFTNVIPPIQGELTAGAAIIPWEARARHQRLTIDIRLLGRYISEGHYYSPLFDPLGTSPSAYLQAPNYEGVDASGNPVGRQVMFQGLTDIEPHGRLSIQPAIEMQAAEYIRFRVGARFGWETPYMVTYSDACNPNFSASPGDPREGNCRGGIINPHHRANIDLPGRRFRLDDQFQVDLFASAIGQF
jgi:hypothetical protein